MTAAWDIPEEDRTERQRFSEEGYGLAMGCSRSINCDADRAVAEAKYAKDRTAFLKRWLDKMVKKIGVEDSVQVLIDVADGVYDQEAVVALGLKTACDKYDAALTNREHGGVAAGHFVTEVKEAIGAPPWKAQ